MNIDTEKLLELSKRLNEEHAKKRSWRNIAGDYPSTVKAGTLCRIAKEKGWYPSSKNSKKILIALGLLVVKHKPDFIKEWEHYPQAERHKVIKQYQKWKKENQ